MYQLYFINLIEEEGYSSEQVKQTNVEVSIDGINRLRKI